MTAARANGDAGGHKVAVGICTHNRPAGLSALLSALDRQRLSGLADDEVLIVVVDNSASGSAQASCLSYASTGRFALSYVREPRKGLSFARNGVIDAARHAGATHLAYIDDDEVPDPDWLAALYGTLIRVGSAAAIGPVYPIFEAPPPAWLPLTAFVTRRGQQNGLVSDGYTCNCILAMSSPAAANLVFDARYNHTGGEDTLFFKSLKEAGGTIAWAETAIVHEIVPRHRMTAKWLWLRWFRTGALEADLSPYDPASVTGKLANLVMGLARIGFGSARVVGGGVRSVFGKRGAFVASFYTVCRGMGLVAKVFGRDYNEYSVPTYR